MIKCNYCGRDHKPGKTNCPANGKKCNQCKENNHFANVCRAKVKNSVHCISTSKDSCSSGTCQSINAKHQSINAISEVREASLFGSTARTELGTSSDYIFSINNGKRGLPTVDICINENEPLLMYIDTCCTLNVIDEHAYNRLITKPQLIGVKNLAWSYQSESPIDFLGEF